jgi:hypothetical protein
MPTPIENLTQNVNASTQQTVLQAVANDATARQQAADKSSAINAIIDNADQQAVQNFFGGIAGDATAEDLLTGDNALIDKVSEDANAIEGLNNDERAIRKILCRREGFDPANFADLNAVAADQGLMQAIAGRGESSKILARSQKASAAASVSQTAMQEVAASQTAMQEVAASQTAIQEVAASQTAMQEVAASQTAMQEVAASQTAMQEVIASQTAMQEVRQSPTADSLFHLSNLYASALDTFASINTSVTGGIDNIAASSGAMQEVAASQAAMQEVAASQAAMQEVASSVTAFNRVATTATARDEIEGSSVAINVLNSFTTSFSEFDSPTNQVTFEQVTDLTDGNGVWVQTATTSGPSAPIHVLNVRGGSFQTTSNKFVFDVTHSGGSNRALNADANTSGQIYRP